MGIFGSIGKALGGIGKAVGSVAKVAAPVLGAIPGVGTLGAAGLGAAGGLLSGGGIGGALKGAAAGASGPILGKIGGAAGAAAGGGNVLTKLGLSGGDLIKGIGAGADYLAGRSDQKFNQGIDSRRTALDEELGRGTLDLNNRRFGLDEELGRGDLALGRDKFGLDQELGRGELALGNRRTDLDTELGRADASLGFSKDAETKRQFDVETGMTAEKRDYDRAVRDRLAKVRSRYVSGLAGGRTFADQMDPPTAAA